MSSNPPSNPHLSRKPTAGMAEVPIQGPLRHDPPVALIEKFRFVLWVAKVAISQAYRDLKMWRLYRPLQAADLAVHYFYLPIGRMDPRLVLSAPRNRMLVRTIPEWMTRDYEELDDLSQCPTREIVNAASNNYGGFTQYEHKSARLIECTLRNLPFNPAPPGLEIQTRKELAKYMCAESCVTTTSGFGANILAFLTVAETAAALSRRCVFLLDRDCHSSMFTGAFMNKSASFNKFNHNDTTDLEYKLRMLNERDPDAFVCVALEGLYSLEGAVSPGPAILELKRIFKFCLLLDDAHGFMALGSGGRGAFEWWQEKGYDCSLSEVDIMSATLSKSVGCTGGFVVANGSCSSILQKQEKTLQHEGAETLSTVALVRTLSLLRKPLLIQNRMQQLKLKSNYVAQRLSEAGCNILSSPGSTIICFPVGTVRQASKFHAEALKQGFAVACGVPPATPLWGCRIRICVFATSSWSDILNLVNMAISVCCKLNIYGVRSMNFDSTSLPLEESEPASVAEQSEKTDVDFEEYIMLLSSSKRDFSPVFDTAKQDEVISAGVQAFRKYGIGPCSARWFYGSFDIFVALERRLALLYPSLKYHAGRCRGMTCADAEVMLSSLINACATPVYSKNVLNLVLIPNDASVLAKKGATLQRSTSKAHTLLYDTPGDLSKPIDKLGTECTSYHITIYLQTIRNGAILDISQEIGKVLTIFNETQLHGLTLILDDKNGLGKIGPRYLGYLDLMEFRHGDSFFQKALGSIAPKTTVIVTGSWFESFGHQGGYAIGKASVIESLTVNSKAFMFSTPPMPVQAAMSDKALEILSESNASEASLFSQESEYLSPSVRTPRSNTQDILLETNMAIDAFGPESYPLDEKIKSKL